MTASNLSNPASDLMKNRTFREMGTLKECGHRAFRPARLRGPRPTDAMIANMRAEKFAASDSSDTSDGSHTSHETQTDS